MLRGLAARTLLPHRPIHFGSTSSRLGATNQPIPYPSRKRVIAHLALQLQLLPKNPYSRPPENPPRLHSPFHKGHGTSHSGDQIIGTRQMRWRIIMIFSFTFSTSLHQPLALPSFIVKKPNPSPLLCDVRSYEEHRIAVCAFCSAIGCR